MWLWWLASACSLFEPVDPRPHIVLLVSDDGGVGGLLDARGHRGADPPDRRVGRPGRQVHPGLRDGIGVLAEPRWAAHGALPATVWA